MLNIILDPYKVEENNPAFSDYFKFIKLLFVGAILISLFVGFATAQDEKYTSIPLTEEFQSDIQNQSASAKDLSVDFVQSKFIQYLGISVESRGQLHFKKPGKIRWQYTEPYEFVLIINNGHFHLSDPQKKMNFKEKENVLFNEIGGIVEESLNGNLLVNDNYEISFFSNSVFYKLSMTPTNSGIKEIIEKVEIVFHKKNFQLSSFRFTEPKGDVTSIRLGNVISNTSLPDSLFSIQ